MTVRMQVLQLLQNKAARYSEIRRTLDRPDKTIYVTLEELKKKRLIMKGEDERYFLTGVGKLELAKLAELKQVCERYDAMMEELKRKEGVGKA